MLLQKIAEVVRPKQFQSYLDKISVKQRHIFEELLLTPTSSSTATAMGNGVTVGAVPPNGVVGRRVSGLGGKSWVEYGAIDDAIIEKLKDDEDARVRLQGAEELNRAVREMPDLSPLLPQMRLFLNFLDSALDEQNPAAVLLILEIYGCLISGLGARLKPHLCAVVASLLRKCSVDSGSGGGVRAEALRTMKQAMAAMGPNQVLNQAFDHLGDKRSSVREAILNVVILALLTFPSYEFDLKVRRQKKIARKTKV